MPSKPDLTLVLDLSACLSIGLVDSGNRTLSRRVKEQGARGETAHTLIEECLAEAGRDLAEVADICVGLGPGSFTGIRVCAALAQGLAFAKRLPLHPFSSLAGILACVPGSMSPGNRADGCIAAIAANAGRYFVRCPSPPPPQAAVLGGRLEALLSAADTFSLASPRTVCVTAGNFPDRDRFRPEFHSLLRFEDVADFGDIARMAHAAAPVLDGVLKPNYLMASAAEEKRRADGHPAPDPGAPAMPPPGDAPK